MSPSSPSILKVSSNSLTNPSHLSTNLDDRVFIFHQTPHKYVQKNKGKTREKILVGIYLLFPFGVMYHHFASKFQIPINFKQLD